MVTAGEKVRVARALEGLPQEVAAVVEKALEAALGRGEGWRTHGFVHGRRRADKL